MFLQTRSNHISKRKYQFLMNSSQVLKQISKTTRRSSQFTYPETSTAQKLISSMKEENQELNQGLVPNKLYVFKKQKNIDKEWQDFLFDKITKDKKHNLKIQSQRQNRLSNLIIPCKYKLANFQKGEPYIAREDLNLKQYVQQKQKESENYLFQPKYLNYLKRQSCCNFLPKQNIPLMKKNLRKIKHKVDEEERQSQVQFVNLKGKQYLTNQKFKPYYEQQQQQPLHRQYKSHVQNELSQMLTTFLKQKPIKKQLSQQGKISYRETCRVNDLQKGFFFHSISIWKKGMDQTSSLNLMLDQIQGIGLQQKIKDSRMGQPIYQLYNTAELQHSIKPYKLQPSERETIIKLQQQNLNQRRKIKRRKKGRRNRKPTKFSKREQSRFQQLKAANEKYHQQKLSKKGNNRFRTEDDIIQEQLMKTSPPLFNTKMEQTSKKLQNMASQLSYPITPNKNKKDRQLQVSQARTFTTKLYEPKEYEIQKEVKEDFHLTSKKSLKLSNASMRRSNNSIRGSNPSLRSSMKKSHYSKNTKKSKRSRATKKERVQPKRNKSSLDQYGSFGDIKDPMKCLPKDIKQKKKDTLQKKRDAIKKRQLQYEKTDKIKMYYYKQNQKTINSWNRQQVERYDDDPVLDFYLKNKIRYGMHNNDNDI